MKKTAINSLYIATLAIMSQGAMASCADIKAAGDLATIANTVVSANQAKKTADTGKADLGGGFYLEMWVTAVDETGKVCQVVNTARAKETATAKNGDKIGNKSWLGSRVISAQKANTANAFSLDGFSISTANLYGLVQEGGSLYGLQFSNPVDAARAYKGSAAKFGTPNDALVGGKIGGVNVFGGGLALYNASGVKVGAIGVSGDTSCTDHATAWRIRSELHLDKVPGGFSTVSGAKGDELVLDVKDLLPNTPTQPTCANPPTAGVAAGNGVLSNIP